MPNRVSEDVFDYWLASVNANVERVLGLSIRDLADLPYSDWWEDCVPADVAARRVIRAAFTGDL